MTSFTRKYALSLLTHPPPDEPNVKRTRHRAPFLPELLDRLRRRQALREFPIAVQTRVAEMSTATVDRVLKPLREQTKARHGVSTTSAGTLLKRQIAIRTR